MLIITKVDPVKRIDKIIKKTNPKFFLYNDNISNGNKNDANACGSEKNAEGLVASFEDCHI